MTRRPSPLVLLLVVLALVGGACGRGGGHDLRLAMRAVALDLAFENKALAEPVEPKVIVKIIPAPPALAAGEVPFEDFAAPELPALPEIPFPLCGKAGTGAAPELATTVGVETPPTPGEYPRHNTGKFKVTGGPFALTLPYPFFTTDTVSDSKEIVDDSVGGQVGQTFVPGKTFEYSILNQITPSISTTTTYQLAPNAIKIVKIVTKNEAVESTFTPSPAIDFVQLNEGAGHTWRSAGVDTATSTALSIEGTIEKNQPIDVCGELIDTYKVVLNETMADLESGSVSGTLDEPNIYYVATQYHGLIVATDQHSTVQTRDAETGTPVTVEYDYTSTINSIEPGTQAFG